MWIVIFHGEIGRNPAAVGEFPMGETCLLTVGLQTRELFSAIPGEL